MMIIINVYLRSLSMKVSFMQLFEGMCRVTESCTRGCCLNESHCCGKYIQTESLCVLKVSSYFHSYRSTWFIG